MAGSMWPLLLAFGVLIAGVGMQGTGVALVLEGQGHASAVAGLIQSTYYVGVASGALVATRWLSPATAPRVLAASSLGGSVFSLLLLLEPGAAGWALLRFLQGMGIAGVYVSVEVTLNHGASNQSRGLVFSIYQVVSYAGMAAGQWAVGLLDAAPRASFTSVGGLFALAAVVAIAWVRPPAEHPAPVAAHPHRHPRDGTAPLSALSTLSALLACSPFGFYVAGVSGLLLSAFYTVLPLVVQDLSANIAATGRYLAVSMLAALGPLLFMARHADRQGRPPVVLWISALMLAGLLALAVEPSARMLWQAGFLYSALVFGLYGQGVSDVNDRISSGQRSLAATTLLLVFALGGCLGPLLLGEAYRRGGVRGYFLVSALVVASVAWSAWVALQQRRARIPECGRGLPVD